MAQGLGQGAGPGRRETSEELIDFIVGSDSSRQRQPWSDGQAGDKAFRVEGFRGLGFRL